ncbi:MAG TPA: OmpH family outer membrane protein [Longimicrobiaceae bacterium]|nr:OmpH family outer membrane protein [Longimicrobiaceae bacterium]
MKRFLSASGLLALALLAGAVRPAEAQAPKFGYVNTDKILSGIPAAAQALQQLEAAATAYQTRADSLGRQFQAMQQAFSNLPVTATAERRQQEQQRLQTTMQQYQQQLQPLQQAAEEREQALQLLVQPYVRRIPEIVEQIRREQNYSMIFSVGESGLVAADPSLDLSDTVRQRLLASPAPAAPAQQPPARRP